ncbi:hypothetical protein X739_14420 [Mesorhizobium sp. LNHC220B00]|nr:hypothetical protein [Mesorhizobium sp. LNHC220B00]ESY86447.1 hypothetical protein X739_14420 [Mesorhizobium sp. LNHC220B00]ESY90806.1 hypothetical protein X741_25625 [Mesorhizobium sp. LNHC229A00]
MSFSSWDKQVFSFLHTGPAIRAAAECGDPLAGIARAYRASFPFFRFQEVGQKILALTLVEFQPAVIAVLFALR